MIRNGDQMRLTCAERRFLEGLVQEPVNPQTIEEYNAWIDYGMRDLTESVPEERLLRATLESMRSSQGTLHDSTHTDRRGARLPATGFSSPCGPGLRLHHRARRKDMTC